MYPYQYISVMFFMTWGLFVPSAYAQETPEALGITKQELRNQDTSITDDQLKEQLWDLFKKQDRRSKTHPKRKLKSIELNSKAYNSEVNGICKIDHLLLRLAPTENDPIHKAPRKERRGNASTRVKAYGFDSHSSYFLLDEKADPNILTEKFRSSLEEHKARFDFSLNYRPHSKNCETTNANMIAGKSEHDVLRGLQLLEAATLKAIRNELDIQFCKATDKIQNCQRTIASFMRNIPNTIEKCSYKGYRYCYKLTFNRNITSQILTITARDSSYTRKQKTGQEYTIGSVSYLEKAKRGVVPITD